jgi:hypothetical protein
VLPCLFPFEASYVTAKVQSGLVHTAMTTYSYDAKPLCSGTTVIKIRNEYLNLMPGGDETKRTDDGSVIRVACIHAPGYLCNLV